MLSTIYASRKNRSLLSTKWVKLTPKISPYWSWHLDYEESSVGGQRGFKVQLWCVKEFTGIKRFIQSLLFINSSVISLKIERI